MRYSIEPKNRKYVKGYGFMSFARNFSDKYGKKLTDTAKILLRLLVKKIVKKSAEATGDFIGNKIADKITGKPIKENDVLIKDIFLQKKGKKLLMN